MLLSWLLLAMPFVLIAVAIIYATVKRFEPIKVIYAGIGLSITGAIVIFVPLSIVQAMNQFATWMETVVIASIINMFIIFPSGLIIIVVGGILYWMRKSKST